MTDTRESRWLPTIIAMRSGKLLINSAIGFDTFLIQRHAIRDIDRQIFSRYDVDKMFDDRSIEPTATSSKMSNPVDMKDQVSAESLGCYFCNDIVAPGNSTLDRTLDQQCTVTRPGVSMLVSALVVELFASIISSPLGHKTPAPAQTPNDRSQLSQSDFHSELGIVPHSIRGDISRYHLYMPTSTSFNKCSACSPQIIKHLFGYNRYENFVKILQDPEEIERACGLKELHHFETSDAIAFDSDEDFANES